MVAYKELFGSRIRHLRQNKGWTQELLCREDGNQPYIFVQYRTWPGKSHLRHAGQTFRRTSSRDVGVIRLWAREKAQRIKGGPGEIN